MAKSPTPKRAPDTNEIATTADGRDITRPFVTDLEQPRDPRLLASQDWGVYDKILMDDQVKSCIEQRIRAVVSAEWDVLPGDEEDARSVEAAEAFKDMLVKAKWDRVCEKMLYAPFHGIAIGELIWKTDADRNLWLFRIKVRHARRFRYDKDGRLRLLTRANPRGEIIDQAKFWVLTSGATNDDEPYGHGLAAWLYWPTLFKRNAIRFWNIFLDKFGTPTVKGTYRRGTPKDDIKKLVSAMRAIATDSGVALPEGTTIDLLQAAKSGTGDFEKIARYMDESIAKVILSQTMTTQDGSSLSQAQVHAGVKLEVVKADADLMSDSFNAGPARLWTDLNFGTDVASPIVVRLIDEEADLKLLAETDAVHKANGWERNEESFRDTYGDGYERKAPEPIADQTPVIPLATPDEVTEVSFAESDPSPADIVDEAVTALLEDNDYRPLTTAMQAVITALESSNNKEDFDLALLAALPDGDRETMVQVLARAGFAVRIAAEVGAD